MAGTTVADDGTVMEAFTAAITEQNLPEATYQQAVDDVRSSMGQSKIEVFRRILGDEAAARKANEAFAAHYAAGVERGAISAITLRGEVMSVKIWIGSAFIWWLRLAVAANAPAVVNRSGAVSPMPRATASSDPVTSPGSAVGSTTRVTTRQRGAPSASAASRSAPGTSSRTTSDARVTIGRISRDNAMEPFQPVNDPPTCPSTRTM